MKHAIKIINNIPCKYYTLFLLLYFLLGISIYGTFTYSYGWMTSAFFYWLPASLLLYIQFVIWMVAILRYSFRIQTYVGILATAALQGYVTYLSSLNLFELEHYRTLIFSIFLFMCVSGALRLFTNMKEGAIFLISTMVFLITASTSRYGRDFLIVTATFNKYEKRVVNQEGGKDLRIPRSHFQEFTPYNGIYELEILGKRVRLETSVHSFYWINNELQRLLESTSVASDYKYDLIFYDKFKNTPSHNYFLPKSTSFSMAIQCSSSTKSVTHNCKRVPGLNRENIQFEYLITEAELPNWKELENSILTVIKSYSL